MDYSLFYNYKNLGDVLLIIFENELIPNHFLSKDDDVFFIYNNDQLIGINIFNFSKIIKIKSNGLIPLPNNEMIDIINFILKKYGIKLDYKKESGFKIGKIVSVLPHPNSEHLHLLKVDIKDEILDIVCGANNVKENEIVVVATLNTTLFNGEKIKKNNLLGFDSYGMCCSEKELNLTNDINKKGLLILDNSYQIGDDFFKISIK